MHVVRLSVFFLCIVASLADTDPAQQTEPEKEEKMNEFDREHVNAGVLSLTDGTFDEAISSHAAVLVKFYAPWCIHSRALAPEFLKAAMILKGKNSNIRLARVDASLEKKLATKYNVVDYPTLKYFKGDSVIEFAGGRTGEAIVSWVETKLLPAATKLSSVEEAEKFAASQPATILGLFKGGATSENAKVLEETSFTRLDEMPCGVADNEELMSHYGVTEDTIVMFKNIDKERLKYSGPFDTDSIATFVKKNKLPLVVEFTHASAPDIFGSNVTKHVLLFVSKSQEEPFKASFSQLREPAKTFKDRVIFIYVDTDADENEKILQFFGVKKGDAPSVAMIALDMNMSKFKPASDEITSDGITEFVKGVLDGSIGPHLPSQKLPDDWNDKPVKVLVSENFDQVSMDQNKTVFVMFYAPFCEHSKELAPVWDQLAEEYAHNDTIVIAKMDSSANELPDMKIMAFPTLKLFPANSNEVLDYHGMDRTLASLKFFLDSGGKKQPGMGDPTEQPAEENKAKEGDDGENASTTDQQDQDATVEAETDGEEKAKVEL